MIPEIALMLSFLAGYLTGSVSPANLIAHLHGTDILSTGNGNAGASNIAMSFGLRSGVFVAAFDILKAFVPAVLAGYLTGMPACSAMAGAGAVLGHAYPVWTGFRRGGKCFASYVGMTVALDWRVFLAILILGIVLVVLTDRIVAMTFLFLSASPIGIYAFGGALPVAGIMAAASVLALFRHRSNISNLIHGKEPGVRAVLFKHHEK